jgi:subtilisin family serine protease
LLFSIFEEQPNRLAVCSQFDLARHITSAVQNGANIINLSCGQLAEQGLAEPRLAAAVELCLRENVLLIAAAGNDGCECVHVPRSCLACW